MNYNTKDSYLKKTAKKATQVAILGLASIAAYSSPATGADFYGNNPSEAKAKEKVVNYDNSFNISKDLKVEAKEEKTEAEEKLSELVDKYLPIAQKFGPNGKSFGVKKGFFSDYRSRGMDELSETIMEVKGYNAILNTEYSKDTKEDLKKAENIFNSLAKSYEAGVKKSNEDSILKGKTALKNSDMNAKRKYSILKEATEKGLEVERANPNSLSQRENLESIFAEYMNLGKNIGYHKINVPVVSNSDGANVLHGLVSKVEEKRYNSKEDLENYQNIENLKENFKGVKDAYFTFKLGDFGELEAITVSKNPNLMFEYEPMLMDGNIKAFPSSPFIQVENVNYKIPTNLAINYMNSMLNKEKSSKVVPIDGTLESSSDGIIDGVTFYTNDGWSKRTEKIGRSTGTSGSSSGTGSSGGSGGSGGGSSGSSGSSGGHGKSGGSGAGAGGSSGGSN